jgi:hypothetical protein
MSSKKEKKQDQTELSMPGHKTKYEENLEKEIIDECIKLTNVQTSTARDIIFKTRDLLKFRSKQPSMDA